MRTLLSVVLLVLHLTGLSPHLPLSSAEKLRDYALGLDRASTHPLATPMAHQDLPEPVLIHPEAKLSLGATNVYAIDLVTARALYSKNPRGKRPIASITKIVTAMVILQSHQFNETVTVGDLPAYKPEDEKIGLSSGQQFKLEALMKAMLIQSANDAADALAIYDSGSIKAFSDKMNLFTRLWGIEGTHFVSSNGLIDTDNYATADGLVKLGKLAITNSKIAAEVASSSVVITSLQGQAYSLTSTNHLLQDGRFIGIKTGYTEAAGQSLLGLAKIGDHTVITAVLNSPDRFGETTTLINWIQENYQWR